MLPVVDGSHIHGMSGDLICLLHVRWFDALASFSRIASREHAAAHPKVRLATHPIAWVTLRAERRPGGVGVL